MTAALFSAPDPDTKAPVPSGWKLAPFCVACRDTGYARYWHPRGVVSQHCGCRVGRRMAEADYALGHGQETPS